MRILVTNHHLDNRAGSELATAELASELTRRGHDVAVFTLIRGLVASELTQSTGIQVLTPADSQLLVRFAPDFIHVHHWPTVVALESLQVTAPWALGFHGGIPSLEHPPPLRTGAHVPWWGMCRRTMERVRSDSTWARQPHRLINNWFDDTSFTRPPITHDRIKRLLVVSNHFPDSLWEMLHLACREHDIALHRVGLPDDSRRLEPWWLAGFDALVTTGRTAVLGQALGIPVLVADELGWDGWVTPDRRALLASRNYSGLATSYRPDSHRLTHWLSAAPTPSQLRSLQNWVYENATLTRAVDHLEALYPATTPTPPSVAFGRWSQTVAEYALHFAAHQ